MAAHVEPTAGGNTAGDMDMPDNAVSCSGKGFGGSLPGQVVLVLQGGGALGSYQAGVQRWVPG